MWVFFQFPVKKRVIDSHCCREVAIDTLHRGDAGKAAFENT